MEYHIDKGILPVLPGDYVWAVGRDPAHLVRAVRVEEVVLRENHEMTVKADKSGVGWRSGEKLFLTAEEAEQEAAKYRKEPPFRFMDLAVTWMPAETWIPVGGEWYGVRIRLEDGSEERHPFQAHGRVLQGQRGDRRSGQGPGGAVGADAPAGSQGDQL